MTTKKKPLTKREKALRDRARKELKAEGILPPDKPRLNRKKFAKETLAAFGEMDVLEADYYLRKAIGCMVSSDMREVSLEQVGVLKLLKLAVETKKFSQHLKDEGRREYTIGEYVDKVVLPITKL